jgi:tetratricopeptide (TPR) repeat protein
LLLILLGRFAEARLELTEHAALFPADYKAEVLWAFLHGLERDLAAAAKVLESLRGRVKDDDLNAIQALVQCFSEFRNPANPPDSVYGIPDLMPHLVQTALKVKRLWRVPPNPDPNAIAAALGPFIQEIPLGPRLRHACLRVLHPLVVGPNNPAAERTLRSLTELATVHPEGTICYIRALALMGNHMYAEAEQAALEAAETPALLLVRQPALYSAFAADCMLYPPRAVEDLRDLPVKTVGLMASPLGQAPLLAAATLAPGVMDNRGQVVLRRAIEHLRKTRALGPSPFPARRELPVMATYLAREYTLARELLDEWEKQAPDDPTALFWRARTELGAGAYGKALEAAEKVLKQKPDNARAIEIKKKAIENILREARPHLQAAPAKSAP